MTGQWRFWEGRPEETTSAHTRKCKSEAGKISSKAGAIIARDGIVIGEAFRGEIDPGDQAVFTLLERKLADDTLAGTTLYVTLEPCTTRNDPKRGLRVRRKQLKGG